MSVKKGELEKAQAREKLMMKKMAALEKYLKFEKRLLTEAIDFLRRVEDDEFCDNDGRSCGSGTPAGKLADKFEVLRAYFVDEISDDYPEFLL